MEARHPQHDHAKTEMEMKQETETDSSLRRQASFSHCWHSRYSIRYSSNSSCRLFNLPPPHHPIRQSRHSSSHIRVIAVIVVCRRRDVTVSPEHRRRIILSSCRD
eukprot:695986-Rhodomonas_salina.1